MTFLPELPQYGGNVPFGNLSNRDSRRFFSRCDIDGGNRVRSGVGDVDRFAVRCEGLRMIPDVNDLAGGPSPPRRVIQIDPVTMLKRD
jgi:hypothetical protein